MAETPLENQPAEADPNLLMLEAVNHFNRAMDYRTEVNLRVATRVTSSLRAVLAGAIVALIGAFLLLSLLFKHMNDLIVTVETMNRHMTSMTEDTHRMLQAVGQIDQDITSMDTIVAQIQWMQQDLGRMDESITKLSSEMDRIDHNMAVMTQDIGRMTGNFAAMEHTVRRIGGDVNQMADPMKPWSSFMPFR